MFCRFIQSLKAISSIGRFDYIRPAEIPILNVDFGNPSIFNNNLQE